MKIINRSHFNLAPDPWRNLNIKTADAERVAVMAQAAAEHQAMVSILGPRGAGKSHALRATLNGKDVKLVEPLRLTRDKMHMGDIESALIRDLSDESPRRSGEARSHQVRRVVGNASQRHNIVLLIDDAHVLHHRTLRSLKRLRELRWLNKSPLLGIILVGQKDKMQGVDEVRLRSDPLWLEGLSASEAAIALSRVVGKVADKEAIARLASGTDARNWLDLQALVDACLARTIARGETTITAECVDDLLSPANQQSAPAVKAPDQDAVNAALKGGRRAA